MKRSEVLLFIRPSSSSCIWLISLRGRHVKNPTARMLEDVGSLHRAEGFDILPPMSPRSKTWSDQLRTDGEDPQAFLLVGQTLVQMLDLAEKGFAPTGEQIVKEQAASVDWLQAYRSSPQVLTRLAQSFGVCTPLALPTHEEDAQSAMRQSMDQLKGLMKRLDGLTDPNTGLFTDDAMQTNELKEMMECLMPQLGRFLIEMKVGIDDVLALMTWKISMRELLASVEAGDDAALLKALSVNPLLASHGAIGRRILQATASREHRLLRQIQKAVAKRSPRHKNAKAGFMMAILWEGGLKRLSYTQIQAFLREAGLHTIPSTEALERCGQRLGLKKYCTE